MLTPGMGTRSHDRGRLQRKGGSSLLGLLGAPREDRLATAGVQAQDEAADEGVAAAAATPALGGRSSGRAAGELNTPWSKLLRQDAAATAAARPAPKRGGARGGASASASSGNSRAAHKKDAPAAAVASATAGAPSSGAKGYASAGPLHRVCAPLPPPAGCVAALVLADPADRACADKADKMRERVSGALGVVWVIPDAAHVGHGLSPGAAGGGSLLSADFASTVSEAASASHAPGSIVYVVASAAPSAAPPSRRKQAGAAAAAPPPQALQFARRRTHRLTCGLLSGATIVSVEWLTACARAGFLVHEAPYVIAGDRDAVGSAEAAARARSDGGSAAAGSSLSPSTPAQRAQAAVASRDPSALLLAGVTVILWGEFERPPKNLTGGEAAELVALAGGRALRLGDLCAIPAAASLRGLALAAAGAHSGTMVQAFSQSQAGAVVEPPESPSAAAAAGLPLEGADDSAEEVWTSLVVQAVRACAGSPPEERGGGGGAPLCGPPCPPLVVVCDEPAFPLPPCVAALSQACVASVAGGAESGGGSGGGFALRRAAVAFVRPEWLESACAAYYRLPTDAPLYRHPAVKERT